jgi:hypothetical protein
VCERGRVSVRESAYEKVCARERECVCVRESVCVKERELEKDIVCVGRRVRKGERESVCV